MWLLLSMTLAALAADPPPWPDLSSPPHVGGGSKDAAVIVAIGDYTRVGDIAGARQNGADWYRYLTQGRGVPGGRVALLIDSQATREEITLAVEAMRTAVQPEGTLWFVFIGHGAPSMEGRDGLLLGSDVAPTAVSVNARGLLQSDLIARLEQGAQAQTVAVVDACFSGRGGSGNPLIPGFDPVLPFTAPPSGAHTTILSACRGDEFAGPLPGASRPAFSYLALGALYGWGDSNQDGSVTAAETVKYSAVALRSVLRGRIQTPQLTGPDLTLSRPVRGPAPPNLAEIRPSLPDPDVPLPCCTTDELHVQGTADLLRRLAEQEAMAKQEAQLQAQLDADIAQQRTAIQREASALWPRYRFLGEQGGQVGKTALEEFIQDYGGVTITLGEQRYPVEIPEAQEAQRLLERIQAASDSTPTIGDMSSSSGAPIIMGSLDKSLIDEVIKRHMNQIRYCYQRELTQNPDLGGKIIIKFVIAKDGTVSSANTKRSTMGAPAVETCIHQIFLRIQFPEPKGGGIVIVSYPFVFTPG